MSVRVDSSSLIAGAVVVGDRGLGVLGSVIRSDTATGDHGPGFLFNDWDAGDDAKEFRGLIVTPPSAGTFFAHEDGSFSLTGAPDGAYSFVYRLFVDGVDLGTSTATITIGATVYRPSSDLSVAGWTFTGAASVAAAMGEAAASDAEFATSPNLTDPATVALSPSLPAGTWTIKLRPRRNLAGAGQVRVRLLNSSSADVGGSDWITPTDSFSLFEVGFTTTGLADRLRIEVQP